MCAKKTPWHNYQINRKKYINNKNPKRGKNMNFNVDINKFNLTEQLSGKRVLITGSGKNGGLGKVSHWQRF